MYEEAIRLNRSHAEAYGQLARLYAAIELEDDAIKTWRRALARVWDPSLAREFVEHLLKADDEKKRQEAKRWLERLVADDPDDVELRVLQAVVWLQEGQHEKAERQLEAIVAEEPLAREALMLLGEQYMETGRYQEAAALWERYADWYPEDEELNMQLAAAYEAAGHIERALAAIERCVHMAKDARLRYERARCLALLGRFDEAKQELEAAFSADESGELAMLAADEPAFHRLERM